MLPNCHYSYPSKGSQALPLLASCADPHKNPLLRPVVQLALIEEVWKLRSYYLGSASRLKLRDTCTLLGNKLWLMAI